MLRAIDFSSFGEFRRMRDYARMTGRCAGCGNKAENFRDALSLKEYTISLLCQGCQDVMFVETFVEGEEEE
jgi:hypothetical protein